MATMEGIYGPTELEDLLSIAGEFVIVQRTCRLRCCFLKSPNLTHVDEDEEESEESDAINYEEEIQEDK